FRMYMGFLTLFGKYTPASAGFLPKYDMRRCTPWQMKDMEMTIWNDKVDYTKIALETVQNKNRRSGKTKDSTRTAVFFDLIGLEVKWRSCYRRQLVMAHYWFSMNPFVRKIRYLDNSVELYGPATYPIDIAQLSPGNVTGVECDIAYFDEGAYAIHGLQLYTAYRNARPMVAPSNCKHIIHFSTPAQDTGFEEAWNDAEIEGELLGTQLTIKRTDVDCPWITSEWVEQERIKHIDCPWFVEQNYKGVWVVYGGAVFTNYMDIRDPRVPKEIREGWDDIVSDKGGVDWNVESTKHYLILGKVTPQYVFIKEELKFWDLDFLKHYHKNVSLEIEDLGFNLPYVRTAKEKGIICRYFGWDMDGKMERVRQLQMRTVIIDKSKCPNTFLNFKQAAHDPKYRQPALLKRTDQHGLDGTLHMVHPVGGQIIYKKAPPMISTMIKGWSK
ncbi:hypothetical protein LCGC14_1332290, partial [marine sediment metagenome]